MKSKKRALRRHHVARAKAKTRRFLQSWGFGGGDHESWLARSVARMHKNRAICSCYSCGNPRRWSSGEERHLMSERRLGKVSDFVLELDHDRQGEGQERDDT